MQTKYSFNRIFKTSTILFIFFICACDPASVIDENQRIEQAKWDKKNNYKFYVSIEDTAASYNFYVNIRNTTDYSFSNIFFFVSTQFPDKKIAVDTIECQLANKEGKWLGKGLGKIKDSRILIRKEMRFPLKGLYIFEIKQAMRVDVLQGIVDIGIRVERQK